MKIRKKSETRAFLDTNVILDYLRKRNKHSTTILRKIKNRKMQVWTSFYTLLELTDRELENKWISKRVKKGESFEDINRTRYPRKLSKKELRSVYDEIVKDFTDVFLAKRMILVNIPTPDDWDEILQLMFRSNVSIGDAIQIIAAIRSNCNLFITRDSALTKVISATNRNLRGGLTALTPEAAEGILNSN